MIQLRIDLYPNIGAFTTPSRRSEFFEDEQEEFALLHFEEIFEGFKKNGKQGYGRVALILRKVEKKDHGHFKELERLRTEVII